MSIRAVSFLALALLLATACQPQPEVVYRQQLFAFGTLIDITTQGVDAAQSRAAVQAVDAMYQQQHRDWHAWQRGALDDLNNAIAAGKSWQTDSSIVKLIRMGQNFERLSGGLFNPAIGELLALWGFQQDEPEGPPPSPQRINAWLSHKPSSLQLTIDGNIVSSQNPHVRLDFGGFAKGYSVGKAVELLEGRGIHNLIINAGGDLCLRGNRGGNKPWRIGIRHPRNTGTLATLELQGAACVFTSGDYERYYIYQGRRYHHILDPRSGYPATATRSVTVIADDPALADAAATALLIAGAEHWQSVAVNMGVTDVLRIDDQDVAWVTPRLAKQIVFDPAWKSVRVVSLKH
ncbi:thiamine biosynthesis lipoprotein [Thiogranum longum]|uniref:FAD:protein FMN transferase n=1 Tax=Thiogranum longum TaxID=1537524 RepID=A0A4R1HAJ2_9GAMM|nr:FAD:protein FMN transferase [Thiogranum longum]TCK17140.1 thiamine biosynthesis lipoprotein [Thiogranum longum]